MSTKVLLCHKCAFFEPYEGSKSNGNCTLLCLSVTRRPNVCIKDRLKVKK